MTLDTPTEVGFLRERVVFLEQQNAKLTDELLKLRREGWRGATETGPQGMPDVAPAFPASVIHAIETRGVNRALKAHLYQFAAGQLVANVEPEAVAKSILDGGGDS